jgi:hypothetical protein
MPINLLTGSIDPMHSSLVRLKLRSRARLHDMTATRANVLEQVNADSSIPKGVKDAIAKLASRAVAHLVESLGVPNAAEI